ncbi:MAG: 3-deoxy-D-manno-octulosonic acid transferase [Pararhodobacter sp.]
MRLYLGFAALSAPLWRLALWLRQRKGREDATRGAEKLGRYTVPRPEGTVLWFHAVSVGEAQALVTLMQRLTAAHPALSILLTTHTLASAQALAARGLPERVIHQFAPADYPAAVRRFLAHWRPDALIVAEADMWPEMLMQARRLGLPMVLINTHVTERRYRRRRRIAATNGYLMNLFDTILVQDEASMTRYLDLGAPADKMSVMGVLKAASDPLPDRPEARAALAAQIGGRPVWLAASTKAIEEPQLMEAHALARRALPDLLLLIAPRQPTEADKTEAAARARFASCAIARRSREEPITPDTAVYIADTIGEMGLWYRLAPVAYTGNSLRVEGTPLTGKNPFEAVALGVMVLHGPDVGNFAEAYARLAAAGGALEVDGPQAMADAVVAAQDPAFRAPYLAGAARVQAENQHPLEVSLAAMEALLARIDRTGA